MFRYDKDSLLRIHYQQVFSLSLLESGVPNAFKHNFWLLDKENYPESGAALSVTRNYSGIIRNRL